MAAVVIQNTKVVPSGATYAQLTGLTWSPTKPALTAIAGVLDTAFGRYILKTGNALSGGLPSAGPLTFTFSTTAASVIPAGSVVTFTSLSWSPTKPALTALAGISHSALGSYVIPRKIRGLLGVSTPSATAVIVVFVSM